MLNVNARERLIIHRELFQNRATRARGSRRTRYGTHNEVKPTRMSTAQSQKLRKFPVLCGGMVKPTSEESAFPLSCLVRSAAKSSVVLASCASFRTRNISLSVLSLSLFVTAAVTKSVFLGAGLGTTRCLTSLSEMLRLPFILGAGLGTCTGPWAGAMALLFGGGDFLGGVPARKLFFFSAGAKMGLRSERSPPSNGGIEQASGELAVVAHQRFYGSPTYNLFSKPAASRRP